MKVGFRLYVALSGEPDVHEVFPSASYNQLAAEERAVLSINLKGFADGPKDMLDAYVAAYTVHEYLAGRGVAVGGGDGLGTIVLPRPLAKNCDAVSRWPTSVGGAAEQGDAADERRYRSQRGARS
jgi:predicted nuclease with RNAse H fold